MWVGHFASGLVAKPFAPGVPLAVLSLAGALPDVVFFLLQFFGIETFNFDAAIAKKGCFPYSNDYPYSHSLAGMIGFGAVLALIYKTYARVPATPRDMAVIVAASASHFLLEWPVHRSDVKITPHGSTEYGAGLFDSPIATFVLENIVFFAGFWVYRTFTPLASQTGIQNNPKLPMIVSIVMILQQAHFCFGAAPTYETRWIHAPAFLSEILGSCYLLGKLDNQTKVVGIQAPKSLKQRNN